MLKIRTDCRQAEATAAAPQQEFKTPQAELEWRREHDRTLRGFVRCLQVIEEADDLFRYDQRRGHLRHRWIEVSKAGKACRGCMGTLLAWYFRCKPTYKCSADDTEYYPERGYDYKHGVMAAAAHLGISTDQLEDDLRHIMNKSDRRPFGLTAWRIRPSKVFARLAAKYPTK